jgi:hypothetical protein
MKTPKTSKSEKPTNSTERLSKLIKKLKRLEQRVKYYQEQWPYGEIDHRGLNTGADNYWSEEVQPFVEAIELDLDELWDCIVSFTRPEDNFGGYYPPTGTLAQNLSHNIKYVLRSRKLSCVHTLIQHLKKIQRRIVIQTGQAEPAEPKPTEGGGGEKVNITELWKQIATEVEDLISQNSYAVERFKEQIRVCNRDWQPYWQSLCDEPPPYDDPTGKKAKPGYEYEPHLQCWFPKDVKRPPDPTVGECEDKLPYYYTILAVIYDSVKGKVAPFLLCDGILDYTAIKWTQCADKTRDRDTLYTAIKWIKADLKEEAKLRLAEPKPTEANNDKTRQRSQRKRRTRKKPEIEHSLPLAWKKWADVFGVSENTLRKWRKDKKYHFNPVSKRRWTLPKNELPAEYLEKYRSHTSQTHTKTQ